MKTSIILAASLLAILTGCAHDNTQAKPDHISHAHHANHHSHHMNANTQTMADCHMMKNFQLRDMPKLPLKSSTKDANEVEAAILENFKDEVKAVAYATYPKGAGIEFVPAQNINRITIRKIGTKLANFIRQITKTNGLIEVNTQINGVSVSKMY